MKVFTVKTAEDMKSDILREIACTYALFGTSYADEDTISRLKTNISMPDRQFLRESEKRKYKNNVVFPYEILTSRIKEYINDCYDKIEKTEQYFLSTADCGGNTEKVKNLFKKNIEKLQQKTTQSILSELDRQLLRNSDIKTVLINVGAEADKQAKSLDNLICYYAKIFAVYYKLNRLAEKGGVYYRIISNGNDCEECHTNVGKSIPINEASAGENFIPFHPNCDCMAEVLDKDGNFIENIGSVNDLYNDENEVFEKILKNVEEIKNISFSKLRHTQRDSGLVGIPDEEISRRARDKSLPGKERKRYEKEEKIRKQRNKQKRENRYKKSKIGKKENNEVNIITVEKPNDFLNNVAKETIIILGIVAGTVYFCYSGDTSIIFKFIG